MGGSRSGYTVAWGAGPGCLEVWADPETATRLFRTMLGLFPSPSTLELRYREGGAPRVRSRIAVGRDAIAEAFESL